MADKAGIKSKFHFISHTHWDREWYLPFENFRFRLVQLIDHLLDILDSDPDFRYFHLDGQTIVLEDYCSIRPGQKARLEALIRAGRILVGPWYQQNDLFLTSAESTVRNLMEGIRLSRELGGEMKVGYLPDHFGLLGQMPQIFRQVGIDNSVFGRGYDYDKHKSPYMRWQAPDGSVVTGILMTYWYNNAQRISDDTEQLGATFQIMKDREEKINPLAHHLMMNGVDHLEAQETLSSALEKLRSRFGEDNEFIHDTLPNYVQTVQAKLAQDPSIPVPVIHGELRERFDYAILGGTLSSRIYIKQANLECHDLIEKWAEPLSVWCAVDGLDSYDSDYFRYIWKLYMENHPHDSICGCSQDAVHDHMMDRFARVKEITNDIIDKKLLVLIKQVSDQGFEAGDQKLLIVNTSQVDSQSLLSMSIYFLEADNVNQFSIEDDSGSSIPYRIVGTRPSRIQVISPINLPGVLQVQRYDIELQPSVPSMGYATYRIRNHQPGRPVSNDSVMKISTSGLPILENNKLKVELQPNGSFHVTDKLTGAVMKHLGQFEEAGDRGDLYVYTSVSGEQKQRWNGNVEIVHHLSNALFEECVYRFEWRLPAELKNQYTEREDRLAACSFQVTLRLEQAASQLNIKIKIDNQVKDHRIRFVCPLPQTAADVWAGGQFDVVRRRWDEGGEFDRDCNSQPFWKWVAPLQASGVLAIFSKGTHEYEMIDHGKSIAITLLRCVENINVRESVALENDIQPKGQCIGQHTIELAVRPFANENATRIYQEAELFHQGLRTKLSPINDPRWEQGRAWVQDTKIEGTFIRPNPNAGKQRIAAKGSFVKVAGNAMVSAVKWSEDKQGLMIRLYNVESAASDVTLEIAGNYRHVISTNLLEEQQGDPLITASPNHRLTKLINAKKIESFKFIV